MLIQSKYLSSHQRWLRWTDGNLAIYLPYLFLMLYRTSAILPKLPLVHSTSLHSSTPWYLWFENKSKIANFGRHGVCYSASNCYCYSASNYSWRSRFVFDHFSRNLVSTQAATKYLQDNRVQLGIWDAIKKKCTNSYFKPFCFPTSSSVSLDGKKVSTKDRQAWGIRNRF